MPADEVYVFDACAVIALLQAEPGASVVSSLLEENHRCLVHAITACEIYYDLFRRDGEEIADERSSRNGFPGPGRGLSHSFYQVVLSRRTALAVINPKARVSLAVRLDVEGPLRIVPRREPPGFRQHRRGGAEAVEGVPRHPLRFQFRPASRYGSGSERR